MAMMTNTTMAASRILVHELRMVTLFVIGSLADMIEEDGSRAGSGDGSGDGLRLAGDEDRPPVGSQLPFEGVDRCLKTLREGWCPLGRFSEGINCQGKEVNTVW